MAGFIQTVTRGSGRLENLQEISIQREVPPGVIKHTMWGPPVMLDGL